MIKLILDNQDGQRTLLIGLSEGNLRNLRAGRPTKPIDLVALAEETGDPRPITRVSFIGGATEDSILAELREATGLVGVPFPEPRET